MNVARDVAPVIDTSGEFALPCAATTRAVRR
jgi:hypothetical protein